MIEDEDRPVAPRRTVAANDLPSPKRSSGFAQAGNGTAEARIDAAVLTIARLIGRQIAREEFERLSTVNDNLPTPGRQNE